MIPEYVSKIKNFNKPKKLDFFLKQTRDRLYN